MKRKQNAVTSKAGTSKAAHKKPIEQYEHTDKKRANIPPVGLVTPETDPIATQGGRPPSKTYQYDPHLDPQLVWAGKAERTSFDIPTISLHVHERIDPRTIMEAVRSQQPEASSQQNTQIPLFGRPEENRPLREEFPFYDHKKPLGWKNRLIAGDSLLVMNSLLEKEGLGGQGGHVQMVYIDPPYGIRYGSNFQPFTNKRDVKDGSDDDLTLEPETLKAFRDTWELGIHSYLTYLRDRLLLAKDLLSESGSCFVQISDENIHHVRELLDEVFGPQNFVSIISYATTSGHSTSYLANTTDFVLFYAKQKDVLKYRQLYGEKSLGTEKGEKYRSVELANGSSRPIRAEEFENPESLPKGARLFTLGDLTSKGWSETGSKPVKFGGSTFVCPTNCHWKTNQDGLKKLGAANRLVPTGERLMFKRYINDFAVYPINNQWTDTSSGFSSADPKIFAVQTRPLIIERCLLMTTDPGDLVLDPTCGSGTSAYVAEQWGRRWITTDTSRVAITLAKQRLMTATFDYYTLAHPEQGVGSGFKYKTVPHVTLKSIANNPEIKEGQSREQIDKAIAKYADTETLYDQPEVDNRKARVTGPFTVEAVPAAAFGQPEVRPITPSPRLRGEGGGEGQGALDEQRPLDSTSR
ncbi:MAG: site-specific DNA-methyltransferase, partial [Tepidisphaeraceae bacterium]